MQVVDVKSNSLIDELEKILGAENVLSAQEDRYCYAFDVLDQGNDVRLPDVVVLPENKFQVQKIVCLASKYNIPIIPRGAGTNHAGACIPLTGGIVMHMSKMNKVINLDIENLQCTVEPGVVVGDIHKLVEANGLFFPPDPSYMAVSMIGGAIGLSSSGPRHYKYGGTKDYVLDLEVVTADGEIINTGAKTAKNVCGYNLTQLFVGSEGTLGIITEATLKLLPKPENQELMLAFFDNIDDAINAVMAITKAKLRPSTLDLMDEHTIEVIEKFNSTGVLKQGKICLIIEVDGTQIDVKNQIEKVKEVCEQCGCSSVTIAQNEQEAQKIWFARRSGFSALAKLGADIITEDNVVPVNKMGEMVKGINAISQKYEIPIYIFGHAGDGNVHPHFSLDLRNLDEKERFEKANAELFALAVSLGGTISGEHGIGVAKRDYMPNNSMKYLNLIKQAFDPKNIFNPRKTLI